MINNQQKQDEIRAKVLDFGCRKGRFFIGSERIFNTPFAVQKLLSRMLIRSARHIWDQDGIEYSGHSFDFEPVESGVRGHWYQLVEKEDGELELMKEND